MSWLATWWNGAKKRAAAPIMFQSGETYRGMGTQPDASVLLRESLGWVAIATRAIADRISSLEIEVAARRRSQAGTIAYETIDDHPLKLLLDQPGRLHSKRATLRLTTQYLLTIGEAYWLKVSGVRTGMPRELYVLKADRITPIVRGGLIDGYEILDGQGRITRYSPDELIRFWLPDPETLYQAEGYLGPQGIDVDALKFASQHLRSRFQNDATPPTVLTGSIDAPAPGSASDLTAFEEAWRVRFHGVMGTKRGLPAWLPSGWDIKQLQMMGGQELVPLLEHWRDQALMAYGVPRSVLGQVVSGDRSSAETNQFVFDLHTVQPIAMLIAETLTDQLARPNFDRNVIVRFAPFVAADKDYELRKEQQDLSLKVRAVNKVLGDRGEDPVEWGELPVGSFADSPYTGEPVSELQAAVYTQEAVDELSAEDDEPEDGNDDNPPSKNAKAHLAGWARAFTPKAEWVRVLARERRWTSPFERTVLRIFAMQRRSVLEALGKSLVPRMAARISDADVQRIVAALGVTEAEARRLIENPVRKLYAEAFAAAVTDLGLADHSTFDFAAVQTRTARQIAARLVTQTTETTRRRLNRQITEGVAQGESIDQIKRRINQVFQGRRANARTIARTEVLHTSQRAQLDGFGRSGVVVSKRWNTSLDERVRDSHTIDAQEVPINDSFVLNDGELADAPGVGAGGGSLSAANTINCRCFVTPVMGD